MLDSLRSFATTWLGKVLGFVLLIGMAGFGVSGFISNIGADTVASVGGQDITTRDFQRAYEAQLNQAARQYGAMPTSQQAVQLGIPSRTLNQLAANAAMNDLGQKMGLGASDRQLGEQLRKNPNFANTLGNFDHTTFTRALRQNGYTEKEFLNSQMDTARRQQIVTAVFADAQMPKAAATLLSRYGQDKRTIDYFTLKADGIVPPAEPTDEEMRAYLTEHQADYRTKPTRTAKLMVLSPEIMAKQMDVSEDAVQAEYERTKNTYVTAEKRDIKQIILPSEDIAKKFQAAIDSGSGVDQLIADNNLSEIDLGTMTRSQIIDPGLADAAFGLAQGEYKIIPAAQGQRAITVTKIVPGGQKPLAEVHDQIAQKIKVDKARQEYLNQLDQIEELRAAFKPLDEIAKRFGLSLHDVKLTASGDGLETIDSIPEEDRGKVATTIFDAQQGDLAPTIALGANRNVWFDLEQVDPARDQTLSEVKDAIHDAIMKQRTDDALKAEADKAAKALDGGEDFADVAASFTQFPKTSQPFTRQGSDEIDPAVAAAAFEGGKDHHGTARTANGDYVVFAVSSVTPDTDIDEQTSNFARNSLLDSTYSDFVTALRNDAGVYVNQSALNNLLAIGSQ